MGVKSSAPAPTRLRASFWTRAGLWLGLNIRQTELK
jgi:hypothetical protein